MKPKILIIGYFGYKTNHIDGQSGKTRNVFNLIKSNEFNNLEINYFDTQTLRYNKFRIITLLKNLFCSQLIYLPGQKNLSYFSPLYIF